MVHLKEIMVDKVVDLFQVNLMDNSTLEGVEELEV